MIKTTNLGFLQLDATPLISVVLAHALDDLDDLAPGFNTLFAQLEKRLGCRVAGVVRILEHAKILAAAFATATTRTLVVIGRRCSRRFTAQPSEDVLNHVADQCFVHCIRHVDFLV